MAKTYEPADHEIRTMLDEVIAEYHPALRDAHVSIAVLMIAHANVEDGDIPPPAITVGGWPAIARVSISSLRDRALGMADAVIEIDAHEWDRRDDAEQRAILDHEARHLSVTVGDDEAKTVKVDSCDRPVLSMRKHDFRVEGFADVIARHKRSAPEIAMVEALMETAKAHQLDLPGLTGASKPSTKRIARAEGGDVETTKRVPRTRAALEAIPGGVQ